jgi:tetratricopeptide (TPR) repeat protein
MRKLILVALVSLLASGAAALQDDEATLAAAQAYAAGLEAQKKGDIDGMITNFEKAISLNSEMYLCHYYLGAAYQAKNDHANTIKHFKKYLERSGVAASSDQGKVANYAVGMALYKSKKTAEAVPYLRKVADAYPKDHNLHYYLAMGLRATDEAAAEKHFAKVIELAPKAALPYYFAGTIAFKRGDHALAAKRLESFVGLKSDGAQAAGAYFILGQLAAQEQRLDQAIGYLDKCIAADPGGSNADKAKSLLEQVKAAQSQPQGS